MGKLIYSLLRRQSTQVGRGLAACKSLIGNRALVFADGDGAPAELRRRPFVAARGRK